MIVALKPPVKRMEAQFTSKCGCVGSSNNQVRPQAPVPPWSLLTSVRGFHSVGHRLKVSEAINLLCQQRKDALV